MRNVLGNKIKKVMIKVMAEPDAVKVYEELKARTLKLVRPPEHVPDTLGIY